MLRFLMARSRRRKLLALRSQYEATCRICQIRQKVYSYGDWTCAKCDQDYKYEEGHMIVLTEEQIEILRTDAEHRLKIMMP